MLITLTAKLKLKDITDVIANEFEETFANYINALNYVSVRYFMLLFLFVATSQQIVDK